MTTASTPPTPLSRRQFGSDNFAGFCPEAWRALEAANVGHAPSYGDDEWTDRASDLIRDFFETDCEVFFAFNGTASNSMAIAHLCKSYHSVLCHPWSHVETDECGAPEFFSHGAKILLVDGKEGKLHLDEIEHAITRRKDIHYPKPKVISLTEATEVGTVYTPQEVGAIGELANGYGLRVHMDGARLGNALAHLECSASDLTWKAGVDVLCFGGTKAGMGVGDAVVFFDREMGFEFDYRCKQAGQLASKMRFLSAPWVGMLEDGAILRYSEHSNRMAQHLHDEIHDLPNVVVLFPRQANGVFVRMPRPVMETMWSKGWRFHWFDEERGARLMCAWDTTEEDVQEFVRDLKTVVS